MGFVGNVLWFIFGGVFAFLGYMIAGLGLLITIIGIPFAIQCFKLGFAVLAPFGKEVRPTQSSGSPLKIIFNIIWLVFFGWELALNHLFWALLLGLTVIGIPFALQHLKLVVLALFPFGQEFVDEDAPRGR